MSNEEFEKYCTGCSNLVTVAFMGSTTFACGGNVECPSKCVLAKKPQTYYELYIKNSVYKCPKSNIKNLALMKAMENGITHGNIHDESTAIDYLTSIGIEVKEVEGDISYENSK